MTVTVMDASVWVSALVPPDINHIASHLWLGQYLADGGGIVIPALLLPEVAGAISRRTGQPDLGHRAANAVLRIPGLRLVPVDARLAGEAAELAADLRLRGADAVYVALAHYLGIPLITWDVEQQARARAVVIVRTP